MKPQTTITLAGILVALLGFLAVVDPRLEGTDDRHSREAVLLNYTPADVEYIRVIRPSNNLDLTVSRPKGEWTIESPIPARADQARIEQFLFRLSSLPRRLTLKPAEPLAQYGFDSDGSMTIEIGRRGAPMVIETGIEPVHGTGTYVRMRGSTDIHVVEADMANMIPRDFEAWWDRRLFPEPSVNASRVEVSWDDRRYEFNRDRSGWRIVSPFSSGTDPFEMSRWLSQLASLEYDTVAVADYRTAALYGFDTASISVSLCRKTPSGERCQTLVVGSPYEVDARNRYATEKGSRHAFVLSERSWQALMPPLDRLRDRRVVPFSPESIRRIDLSSGEEPISLVRSEGGPWIMTNRPLVRIDPSVPEQLLADWSSPVTLEFDLTNSPFLNTPTNGSEGFRISFWEDDPAGSGVEARRVHAIHVIRPSHADRAFVQQAEDRAVSSVPVELYDALPRALIDFRDRYIWSTLGDVVGVSWSMDGFTSRWDVAAADSSVTPSHGVAISRDEGSPWIDKLRRIQVDRWVGQDVPDLARFGLDNPTATLRIETDRPSVYLFSTSSAPDVVFGVVRGEGAVFSLSPDVWPTIMSPAYASIHARTNAAPVLTPQVP